MKTVSGAIFEWAATQFSLTLSESTGAVCDDESMRQLWKTFFVMISYRAATLFSLTGFDSTGAVWADESMCHISK